MPSSNAPQLGCLEEIELTPIDGPEPGFRSLGDFDRRSKWQFANRPEVLLAMKQIKAAGVRVDVAKNEILPLLDVVMETYVGGLARVIAMSATRLSTNSAWGHPATTAGLRMEVPIGNRAGVRVSSRRALEMRQFQSQLRATLAALQLEVEIAVREVQTAHREIEAKYQALDAAVTEVDFIERRWKHLAGDDRAASLFLEDLFSAQERQTSQEFEYLSAEVDYNLAMIELQRRDGNAVFISKVSAPAERTRTVFRYWNYIRRASGHECRSFRHRSRRFTIMAGSTARLAIVRVPWTRRSWARYGRWPRNSRPAVTTNSASRATVFASGGRGRDATCFIPR